MLLFFYLCCLHNYINSAIQSCQRGKISIYYFSVEFVHYVHNLQVCKIWIPNFLSNVEMRDFFLLIFLYMWSKLVYIHCLKSLKIIKQASAILLLLKYFGSGIKFVIFINIIIQVFDRNVKCRFQLFVGVYICLGILFLKVKSFQH